MLWNRDDYKFEHNNFALSGESQQTSMRCCIGKYDHHVTFCSQDEYIIEEWFASSIWSQQWLGDIVMKGVMSAIHIPQLLKLLNCHLFPCAMGLFQILG